MPEELARSIRGKAIASGLSGGPAARAERQRARPAVGGAGGAGARPGARTRAADTGRAAEQHPAGLPGRAAGAVPAVRHPRRATNFVAMTEPDAGSDVRSMTTTAVRRDGVFVVNGTKIFISRADVADFVILFAATGVEETAKGPKKQSRRC